MNSIHLVPVEGRVPYAAGLEWQREVARAKFDGDLAEVLVLLLEHEPVVTLGRGARDSNVVASPGILESAGVSTVEVERGGDVTYHGPGQIVGYPVIDLEALGIKVKDYVWKLEESVIRTLGHFDLKGERIEGATGVWLDTGIPGKTRKICAIGVRVSRYVTMHGFAFNVNTNLEYFDFINPCGFTDKGVTSLQKELGRDVDIEEVKQNLKSSLKEVFKISLIED